MYKVADIFCGCGGFSEGFRLAGHDIVFAVDKWEPAVITHHANHPKSETILDDVIRISKLPDDEFHNIIPNTEIILGSPPCTDFSSSNKSGNGDKSLGIELIKAYLRIVARKKFMRGSILKHWILENVPNVEGYIKSEYNLEELSINKSSVLKVKYDSSRVYNAKYFGVASNRKRYLCGDFPEPIETIKFEKNLKTVNDILSFLTDSGNNINITIKDPNYYDFIMNRNDITDHSYIIELADFEWNKAKRAKQDKGYMGKMSFPEDINKPSRTIMATMSYSSRESMIYRYKENRYRLPTIREIASLMSYSINYRFYGKSQGIKYKLVGNSVPPKMAYALADAINKKYGIKTRRIYKPISFNEDGFYNLNFKKFEVKKEKPKKNSAKFKYHIPYLILNSYRVELTNYHSDFNNLDFKWCVEIHKSQGKNAKIFTPTIDSSILQNNIKNQTDTFINKIKKQIKSSNNFQRIYCKTSEEIMNNNELGPYELLDRTKMFIEKVLTKEEFQKNMTIDMEPFNLPKAILLGYIILNKIIN